MPYLSAIYTPQQIMTTLAQQAKMIRLSQNLSRQSLAEISGVPASTIKQFETTGKISLNSLVLLAMALGEAHQLLQLFNRDPQNHQEIKNYTRQRGRK